VINPVLRANTFFSVLLSIYTPATGGTAFVDGATVYKAVANASSSFSTFSSSDGGCSSPSRFICTVNLFDSNGSLGTGSDRFVLLSGIGNSPAFDIAVVETRALSFQYSFFLADFFVNTVTSESVIPDLRPLA